MYLSSAYRTNDSFSPGFIVHLHLEGTSSYILEKILEASYRKALNYEYQTKNIRHNSYLNIHHDSQTKGAMEGLVYPKITPHENDIVFFSSNPFYFFFANERIFRP